VGRRERGEVEGLDPGLLIGSSCSDRRPAEQRLRRPSRFLGVGPPRALGRRRGPRRSSHAHELRATSPRPAWSALDEPFRGRRAHWAARGVVGTRAQSTSCSPAAQPTDEHALLIPSRGGRPREPNPRETATSGDAASTRRSQRRVAAGSGAAMSSTCSPDLRDAAPGQRDARWARGAHCVAWRAGECRGSGVQAAPRAPRSPTVTRRAPRPPQ